VGLKHFIKNLDLFEKWRMRFSDTVRLIRVYVSSARDVADERQAMEEVVAAINRTDGDAGNFRLETFQWTKDVVTRLGGRPQEIVNEKPPPYDIFVGIMAARFGQPTGTHSSGTEEEFRAAYSRYEQTEAPWIAFYFRDQVIPGTNLDALQQYMKVCEFRKELETKGLAQGYVGVNGDAQSFRAKIDEHLRKFARQLIPREAGDLAPLSDADPRKYLRALADLTGFIDIKGIQVGQNPVNRFPIEDLFITLTTTAAVAGSEQRGSKSPKKSSKTKPPAKNADFYPERQTIPLEQSLAEDRLVIIGDPGAGKSTFLNRITHALCRQELGLVPAAELQKLGIPDRTFPVYVRVGRLSQYLLQHQNDHDAPVADSAAWLCRFLAQNCANNGWGLDAEFFETQLADGRATVLLDGLDEAPDRTLRERVSRVVESVARSYGGCRFVASSRPAAYTSGAVLAGFAQVRIDPLSVEAVETFLRRWCQAVYVEGTAVAERRRVELSAALRARPEIRRMARTPLMLTVLAVVHWHEKCLPEQRAELYEWVLRWLARSRQDQKTNSGRETAERTLELLRELALGMQTHPRGVLKQIPQRQAAELLAEEFANGKLDHKATDRAQAFLESEELDSGIIVKRGGEIEFWHRTFQEYLAARALAARTESDRNKLLFGPPVRVYQSEWNEVMALLASVLHGFGKDMVDNLIGKLITRLGPGAELVDEARCAGLVGVMLRDLRPSNYQPPNTQFDELLHRVTAIFDRDRCSGVPVTIRIAAADALAQVGDARIDVTRTDYWVTIPACQFRRGAQKTDASQPNFDADAKASEGTVQQVTLSEYQIARYPVTVGQYMEFMNDGGYVKPDLWSAGGFGEFGSEPEGWDRQLPHPSRPVVGVSWFEAKAYCSWSGFRLLTEAEWERGARGLHSHRYPWGDDPPDETIANFNQNIGHPTPVGIFPLGNSAEGVCDLAGNVWEWCEDWHCDYETEHATNPVGPKTGSNRVVRGGSWVGGADHCRSAFRSGDRPYFRDNDLGFRLAPRSVQEQAERRHEGRRR
ncbi:MAG: SUMF1/EgtB/PvdO family nonheme iron enzyme, partial [Planctomycetota bacterium]|nr:SUMF1/EgtB/PvdO family nonheme iron enzyme [Planctomycetota bacterium]